MANQWTSLHTKSCSWEAQRPPESGGQHDRDEVEIVRGEVPEQDDYKVRSGTSPRATLSGRAALLTQEGVALLLKIILIIPLIASVSGCAPGSTESKDQAASAIPRTADGKPDLTGVYQGGSSRRGPWDFQVPGDQPGVATPETQSVFPAAQVRKDPIPFQPWAKAKAQEYLNMRSVDDPAGRCLPGPGPRLHMVGLFPIQIVQTPEQIIILYEYFTVFRVIPLNAKHPEDLEPSFMGNSVGHWEGDTLVVDVVGFNDKGWVQAGAIFHSDALHITERYTRVDRDTINYEATIDDPKVFTKPFTSSTTLMLREGARLREYICAENNEDIQRYEELLKRPELFRRTPPAEGK